MRLSPALLLLPVMIVVFYAVYTTKAAEPPTEQAQIFLQKLKANDLPEVLREFGDNTCHCAPPGGYISYLQYESANEPNLAFLRGQAFNVASMRFEPLPFNGEKYLLPWDKPEDTLVYAQLDFDGANRPYFLPLDTAFGHKVPEQQLQSFSADPATDWKKAFSLRLRPTLEPGLIKTQETNNSTNSAARAIAESALPPELARYLTPADAGAIELTDGKSCPASACADKFPRLKSVELGLKIVRRGAFARWAVQKLAFKNPVFESDGKTFTGKE